MCISFVTKGRHVRLTIVLQPPSPNLQAAMEVEAAIPAPEPAAAPAAAPAPAQPDLRPPGSNPMKKRKVAMFLAYVGHGYQGMQRNPGARTIEDELFKALHAAGAISDANADDNGFMKVLRGGGGGGWRRRRRVPPAAAVALLGTAGLVAAALPHAFSLHPHAPRLPPVLSPPTWPADPLDAGSPYRQGCECCGPGGEPEDGAGARGHATAHQRSPA